MGARVIIARMNPPTPLGILCVILPLGLAACEREGAAEKAGRAVDKAAKDVRDAVKGK